MFSCNAMQFATLCYMKYDRTTQRLQALPPSAYPSLLYYH